MTRLLQHPAVVQLRAQLDATPWLRWALLGIGLLLGLLVLDALNSQRMQWQKAAIEEEVKLRRMKSLQGQDVWLERARESASLREALYAQIPPANTLGAAQAALQSWMQSVANSASDPQKLRITLDSSAPVEGLPGVVQLRSTLRGPMSPRQALAMLRKIEGGEALVVVDSFEMRTTPSTGATISVSAYYQVAGTVQEQKP